MSAAGRNTAEVAWSMLRALPRISLGNIRGSRNPKKVKIALRKLSVIV